ncbi:MAG: hypothetical protein H0T42_27705 [Deltaproteobacteria bacterium]|nr:hypothetical protein [Deltaproteobacteria bacterium]
MISVLSVIALSCDGGGPSNPFVDPPCSDKIDNDGDGLTDYPDDPGCVHPTDDSEDSGAMPLCSDGRDNDGDGLTDYPYDPGCTLPNVDDETDDCPGGPSCPQCANGVDDDLNGTIDHGSDPGCQSAGDPTEVIDDPDACGAMLQVRHLPPDGKDSGTLDASSVSGLATSCGGGGGAPAIAYVFALSRPMVVVASTNSAATMVDTVLDLRSAECAGSGSSLACNDDVVGSPGTTSSTITKALGAGTYYVIVQGADVTQIGEYSLTVDRFAGEGSACSSIPDCGPGLLCRIPAGGAQLVCSQPVCGDGLDDDGDGKLDFPADPGCVSAVDADEADDCPSGPGCPDCSDGVDNDLDSLIDYPADTTCKAASNDSEACATTEGVVALTMPVTMGDLTSATHDVFPTCSLTTAMAKDRAYRLDVPTLSSLVLTVTGVDTVTSLLNSSCAGTPIQCGDAQTMTLANVAAGAYFFVVDGRVTTTTGAYTINASGKIANGASCESALAQSGAFTCGDGFACKGAAGA